jgi:hypothetical protein
MIFARIFFAMVAMAFLAAAARAQAIEVGMMVGRDGAAFGPGVLLQGNIGPIGLYGFAGNSSIHGYDAGNGIKANFSDRTSGFGIAGRVLQTKHFVVGGFAQAAYNGSHVHATYLDPTYGVEVDYRSSSKNPLITIGPEFDWRIGKRISIFMRPGENFGDAFAATTAKGFSLNGGVKFDVVTIGRGVTSGFRKMFQ